MQVHTFEGRGFDSNQYLVVNAKGEEKKAIIIDTGSGLYAKDTLSFVKHRVPSVDAIVLTHRHIDHVGGAKFLSEALGCKIYASTDDSMPLITGKHDLTIPLGLDIPKLEVSNLEYGAVIENQGLEIIHSPGHTVGGIMLYDKETRSLFSGDTIFAHGGVGRWDLETGNVTQLRQSIKRIVDLNIENLYPGHGPYVEGGAHEHAVMSLGSLESLGV